MGNCQSIHNVDTNDVFYPCCSSEQRIETKEIKCGREFIEYYLENKIEKFYINFAKFVLVDKSDKAYSVEIEPSSNYFQIMKSHSKFNNFSTTQPEKNPLGDFIPFPIHLTNLDHYSEHPYICYNFHPVMGSKISQMQIKKENIIFNDIVQEGHLIDQEEKYLKLAKKFIDNAKSTEKIVENILQLLTEPNSFFQHLHKTLCDQTSATFLGSLVFTLNTAIRHDFLNFKSDRRCFRKAVLSQREITEYYTIFGSESKRFCWQSFATAYLDPKAYLAQLNFNAVFVIDFLTDSFGAEIGNYSISGISGEILLPAMSLFEMRDMAVKKFEGNVELLQISLVKIDQNPIGKAKSSLVTKERDLSKIMKVMQYELSLLKVAEESNKDKYTYLQDELNFFLIKFAVSGPQRSPYENGLFQVNFEIPKNYPNKAPDVRFTTKIWHPNIHFETGVLKHPVLQRKWKPSCSVADLIQSVMQIVSQPEIYELDSANPIACKEYFENRKVFEIKAREYTSEYAKDRRLKQNQHLRISDFKTTESRRSLLKNDLLTSLNSEDYNVVKLNNDGNNFNDDNNDKNSNYNYNNKNVNDLNLNSHPFKKVNANEVNSEIIEGSESNRNEALEKEEFQKVKNSEIRNPSGNKGKINNNNNVINFNGVLNVNNNNFVYKNIQNTNDQISNINNKNKNHNKNENDSTIYNGYYQVFIPESDFEEAENFEMKTDNDIDVINNVKKKKSNELTRNISQEKQQHSNYEVDFDSKKDINLSENYEQ